MLRPLEAYNRALAVYAVETMRAFAKRSGLVNEQSGVNAIAQNYAVA